MFRCSSYPRAFAVALIFVALAAAEALAHCFVGARFLPATLATDDPCVADEMSLPTVSWSKTADMPPASQWDIGFDLSKRITENFGVTISQDWTQIRQANGTVTQGFSNFGTTFQYQILKDREHELAILAGVIVDWGHTGSAASGFAAAYRLLTPTLYFGKGFGDLPESFSWFRAFAVTGQVGYQVPTNSFDFTQNAFIPQ